jgi:hypothetical protein
VPQSDIELDLPLPPRTVLVDWQAVSGCRGNLCGVELDKLGELEADALEVAVRTAFEVNAVPAYVIGALDAAKRAVRGARYAVAMLGDVVLRAYGELALDETGHPLTPAEIESRRAAEADAAAEAARAEAFAKATAHRPASRR